ncbi:unnamed protein product [Camellia sinensis]
MDPHKWTFHVLGISYSIYLCSSFNFEEEVMTIAETSGSPTRLQGKYGAMVVCWILGLGSLVSWNSMLTIGDYYYNLFPKYHPSRVLTLVYQPFALGTMAILAYNESKIDTRRRNLTGYILFFISTSALLVAEDDDKQQRLSNKQLFTQNIDYALGLYLIYVLTLSIFPGFLYENTGSHHKLGSWYPLVLIAMYNLFDLISRYIPLVECLKIKSRKGLMISILSRFLLIPAFYFTAKYGDQGWMIMLTSFLGLTNGYLTVCVLTEAPKSYKGPEQNALGNLLVLFLLAGIFSGVAVDWLWLIGSKQQF